MAGFSPFDEEQSLVGSKAPESYEANWIDTAGKRPMPMFRFYGPEDALNQKTFKLPDFKLVK